MTRIQENLVATDEAVEPATAKPTPEEVIEAVRTLNAHMPSQAVVGWERGTTAIAIFVGDMTQVIRYTMSEDLSRVVSSDQVRRP